MKRSFDGLKQELDEACEFMRSFTLGRQGFTMRDGVAAIGRVGVLCERMQKYFGSGARKGYCHRRRLGQGPGPVGAGTPRPPEEVRRFGAVLL